MSMQINFDGNQKPVPAEVQGWNWGAFFLTWIWGICNGTFISLLSLIPGVHFIMMIVLGIKGNEWAWKSKDWPSVEAFHRAQRKWAIWAISIWAIGAALLIAIPLGILTWGVEKEMPEIQSVMKDFNPHRNYTNFALEEASRNSRCQEYFGSNMHIEGPVEVSGVKNGYSEVRVPVRGARNSGSIYLRVRHNLGAAEDRLRTKLEKAEVELQNLEHVKINTEVSEERIRAAEHKVETIISATKKKLSFNGREPSSADEAKEFFRAAMDRVEADSQVKTLLGAQIKTFMKKADVDLEGPLGIAEFHILMQGNGKEGLLDLRGTRSMGRWQIEGACLNIDGKTINFPYKEVEPTETI